MKWINGRTIMAKIHRRKNWHRWFAWYPVIIGQTGTGEEEREVKVWLQYVERMKEGLRRSNYWRYREISKARDEFEKIKAKIEREDIK